MIELALAFVQNLSEVMEVFAILSGLGTIGLTIFYFVLKFDPFLEDKNAHEKVKPFIVKTGLVFVFILPVSLLPSIEDLWKVRISLIKFRLASPENLEKGATEIARIAKKLECKYLGDCEKEKKND